MAWSGTDLETFQHELGLYEPAEALTADRLLQEMIGAVTAVYPDDQWTKYTDKVPSADACAQAAGTPFVQPLRTRVKLAPKKTTADKLLDILRPIRKEVFGDVGTGMDAGGFFSHETSPGVAGGSLGLDLIASLLFIGSNAVAKEQLKSAMKETGDQHGHVDVAQYIDKVLGTVVVDLRVGVLGPEHLGDLLALGDLSYKLSLDGVANANLNESGIVRIRNNSATIVRGEQLTDNDLTEYANWQALLYNHGVHHLAPL